MRSKVWVWSSYKRLKNITRKIQRNLRNKIWLCIQNKFYKTTAVPTLRHASEVWFMMKKDCSETRSTEMQFIWNTLNYTLQDRRRNEDVRREIEVKGISTIISTYGRQQCDNLQMMMEDWLPKVVMKYNVIGRREVGCLRIRCVLQQVYIT